jgi:hypothetical protein
MGTWHWNRMFFLPPVSENGLFRIGAGMRKWGRKFLNPFLYRNIPSPHFVGFFIN